MVTINPKTALIISLLFLYGTSGFASDLQKCPSDTTVVWTECFGTYEYDSGAKFVGEFKNDVVSWSQKFPKELGIGNAIIAHSFNRATNQYAGKTKMKIASQSMVIEAWATCDRY